MDLSLEEIDEELRSLGSLKSSLELQLAEIRAGSKETEIYVSSNQLDLVTKLDILSKSIKITLSDHVYDYFNSFQIKEPVFEDKNNLINLWDCKFNQEYVPSIDRFENFVQRRLDNFYWSCEDVNQEQYLNHYDYYDSGFVFYDAFSLFHEQIHLSNVFEQYETYFIRIINEIQSRLIFLSRQKKVLFYLDKRTQFRRIIKFLFKNLDDEHSSSNNSIVLKFKNYLLRKNLYGKEIYSWAC
jgi:hypothetical protein